MNDREPYDRQMAVALGYRPPKERAPVVVAKGYGRVADRMKGSLRGLGVVATVSPLLGLLGTIFGMINAFRETAAETTGAGKPADLATGIYEALVTTATGLTIAIPVLLLYQFLSRRADRMIEALSVAASDFMLFCATGGSVPPAPPKPEPEPAPVSEA